MNYQLAQVFRIVGVATALCGAMAPASAEYKRQTKVYRGPGNESKKPSFMQLPKGFHSLGRHHLQRNRIAARLPWTNAAKLKREHHANNTLAEKRLAQKKGKVTFYGYIGGEGKSRLWGNASQGVWHRAVVTLDFDKNIRTITGDHGYYSRNYTKRTVELMDGDRKVEVTQKYKKPSAASPANLRELGFQRVRVYKPGSSQYVEQANKDYWTAGRGTRRTSKVWQVKFAYDGWNPKDPTFKYLLSQKGWIESATRKLKQTHRSFPLSSYMGRPDQQW